MADAPIQETILTKVVRLETVVEGLVTDKLVTISNDNKEAHAQIIETVKELATKEDLAMAKMDVRMKACEDANIERNITWKTLAKVGTTTITVIGVAVALFKLILGI